MIISNYRVDVKTQLFYDLQEKVVISQLCSTEMQKSSLVKDVLPPFDLAANANHAPHLLQAPGVPRLGDRSASVS